MSEAAATPRRALVIAFLTVCLDLLGFGIIIPIQPFYAEAFGASPSTVTLLGASYSLMQFLFVPFWGRLSDRIGRRPVILISILLGSLGYLIFGLADALWVLFAARLLSGFGNANIAAAQAVIADVTTGRDRARGMGLIGAAFGLGFIFGPALGGVLGQFGLAVPAYGAAALGALNLVFALIMLPETRRPQAAPSVRAAPWQGLRRLVGRRDVALLILLSLILTTGFALMEQSLGLFIERTWVPEAATLGDGEARREALRHAAALTSYVLVVVGVTATIVQGGLIGRLSRRFGERALIRVGGVGLAIAFALIPVVGGFGVYLLELPVAVMLASSTGIATPSLNSLISRSVGAEEQGATLGLGQSASALGRVLGPAASGALFEWAPRAPFLAGSVMMLAVFGVALLIKAPAEPAEAPGGEPPAK